MAEVVERLKDMSSPARPALTSVPLHSTVASRVAEQLRSEIRSGAIPAGAPLRQNDVADRLGVSSTPVREAFQILERLGLVLRDQRRGVRVFIPSLDDLIASYEIRSALESLAVRKATAHITAKDIKHLRGMLRMMDDRSLPHEDFMGLNSEFHDYIAAFSGSERLTRLIAAEQLATASYVVYLGVDSRSSTAARKEHSAILNAIAAGDADAAANAMAAHLDARLLALGHRLPAPTSAT